MKNYIIFDGVDSREFGVAIFHLDIDSIPQRDVEEYEVPGRNGNLIIDRGGFLNIDHVYVVISYGENHRQLRAFINELSRHPGYKRLEDSFEPDEFYSARIKEKVEVTTWRDRDSSRFELWFDRDPRRFLTLGEIETDLTNGDTITNPTAFASNPLIKVTGDGTLTIGEQTVTIADTFAETVIDSEMQDCYSGEYNANSAVTFGNGRFPVLEPGNNEITIDGDITAVEITPRWWRL